MSSVLSLITDLVMIGLLSATAIIAFVLNRKMTRVRDGSAELTQAVTALSEAIERAEDTIATMKRTSDESAKLLDRRIEEGRRIVSLIEAATAPRPAAPVTAPVSELPKEAAPKAEASGRTVIRPPSRLRTGQEAGR